MRNPTDKQWSFAIAIASRLGLDLPTEYSFRAYQEFISENEPRYYKYKRLGIDKKRHPLDPNKDKPVVPLAYITVEDLLQYIKDNDIKPDAEIYVETSLRNTDGAVHNIGTYEDGSLVLER